MQNETCRLQHTDVLTPVLLPDTVSEQSIELDYVLPDYYPDFFRLCACTAKADAVSVQIADGAADYTLRVQLHVLYCGEQTRTVQAVTQQLEYRKTAKLPAEYASLTSPQLRITAEPAYVNCRAVSPRRIDLRGAIRIRISVSGERQTAVLTAAEGMYMQSRSEPVTFVSSVRRTEKKFVMAEQFRIGETQPAILSVLREQTVLRITETKPAAGKLVVKGEAAVTLLYASAEGISSAESVFPFSQIAEPEALTDDTVCTVTPVLSTLSLLPESENDGDIRMMHCDMQITLVCEAVNTQSAELLTDLYSTVYDIDPQISAITLLTAPEPVSVHYAPKLTLTQPDAVLTAVYGAWAEPEQLSLSAAENGSILTGVLHVYVMAADAEQHPVMLEKAEDFTWEVPELSAALPLPPVSAGRCSYTLTGSDSVSVQPELTVSGMQLRTRTVRAVTDTGADGAERYPAGGDYAMRLYFGQPEESLWEIAKRYHTAAEAIRDENDLPEDVLTAPQMLLIPNVKARQPGRA